ncbi:TniB family NTP-binding protein [Pararobbsia alpina]|uniref:TniB family NTP-binding protein n=1 Tax=Pararobbsia alpina TaxID=621374 RepID=UPI0031B60C2F
MLEDDLDRGCSVPEWTIRAPPASSAPGTDAVLIHGDSNIGKTKITTKLRRAHPNKFDDRSCVERWSGVAMQMQRPTGIDFTRAIF